MKVTNGAGILVEALAAQGVTHVFSISGGQMSAAYDVMDRRGDMAVVTPRCETSAPIMAAGYIASTGRPAVSMCTVGAGVVYEMGGMAVPWLRYLPVVSIAPQVQSWKMKPHQASLQACDQDELFKPVAKFTAVAGQAGRIPQLVNRAFREALSGSPGPVHLDVPVDVMMGRKFLSAGKYASLFPHPSSTRYGGRIPGDPEAAARAVDAVKKARKPLVVLGQGVGRPCRAPGVPALLENLNVPVLTTLLCTGVSGAKSPVFAGDLSAFAQSGEGAKILAEADAVVVLAA
ncbi:MAG: thiamine pyrophosphate-binding protein, partial [Deltaproteobacteria bacterium]|nr:thiamine pyrophosphate-binding protein [Deltaproteobacteria bacterium]